MSEDNKQCPFCGCSELNCTIISVQGSRRLLIQCVACGASGPQIAIDASSPANRQKVAYEAWNRRASTPHAYAILVGKQFITAVDTAAEVEQVFTDFSEEQMKEVTLFRYDKALQNFTKKKVE